MQTLIFSIMVIIGIYAVYCIIDIFRIHKKIFGKNSKSDEEKI
jgi:uncharacterized membrane protein YuzA (DUF378 family)